jgi:hypothetical protein
LGNTLIGSNMATCDGEIGRDFAPRRRPKEPLCCEPRQLTDTSSPLGTASELSQMPPGLEKRAAHGATFIRPFQGR